MSTELATQDTGRTELKTANNAISQSQSARQIAEVQAQMFVAKQYPRDETAAINRILQSCRRKALAETAMYVYPRGGTKVTGPSIRLAETLARCWGNMDFGIVELEQRNGESSVMAYAVDLETNVRQTKTFTVKHQRKARGSVVNLDDPRDVYEMTANQGARRLRACILGVIPGDVQDSAIAECNKTLREGNSEPLIDRVRKMVDAFGKEFQVTQEMIEKRIGHDIGATDEHELAMLRGIFQGMRDGMSKREDHFEVEKPREKRATKSAANKD